MSPLEMFCDQSILILSYGALSAGVEFEKLLFQTGRMAINIWILERTK